MEHNQGKLPYTLAFKLPSEAGNIISAYRRKLAGVCEKFEPIESAHLTVKYLGYPSPELSEHELVALIPEIARIARPFLPIKIFSRGIGFFEYDSPENRVVYLKILFNQTLMTMHERICKSLAKRIDAFTHAEGSNFTPHVTISKSLLPGRIETLNRLIFRSHKSAKRSFKLSDLVILTSGQTIHIFPGKTGLQFRHPEDRASAL